MNGTSTQRLNISHYLMYRSTHNNVDLKIVDQSFFIPRGDFTALSPSRDRGTQALYGRGVHRPNRECPANPKAFEAIHCCRKPRSRKACHFRGFPTADYKNESN